MYLFIALLVAFVAFKIIAKIDYNNMESAVLQELGFKDWNIVPYFDYSVTVKSRQALEKYDDIRFFKENREKLSEANDILKKKADIATLLNKFLDTNKYKSNFQYRQLVNHINAVLKNSAAYRIRVSYISSAGNNLGQKEILVTPQSLDKFEKDPSLLMGKGEYSKYLKEQQRAALEQKHHEYYEHINKIIDYANTNRDSLVIKGSQEQLDNLVAQLFDRTVNSIKKIKTVDSEEWALIGDFMLHIEKQIEEIVAKNQQILAYYESPDFLKIKETCEVLMSTQREFNEYIAEKVHSISELFGTRVVRNETVHEDEYNYIRPYKKTITPFTAEVSAAVFASAENSPLEYIVKNFYPNKKAYPEQIRNLYHLVEELQTLRDARQIIENYKAEYQQYLSDVPAFIMENDEEGFY